MAWIFVILSFKVSRFGWMLHFHKGLVSQTQSHIHSPKLLQYYIQGNILTLKTDNKSCQSRFLDESFVEGKTPFLNWSEKLSWTKGKGDRNSDVLPQGYPLFYHWPLWKAMFLKIGATDSCWRGGFTFTIVRARRINKNGSRSGRSGCRDNHGSCWYLKETGQCSISSKSVKDFPLVLRQIIDHVGNGSYHNHTGTLNIADMEGWNVAEI